jgi:protease-4
VDELNSGRDRSPLTVWQFFRGLAKFVVGGALLLQALLFLLVFAAVLSLLSGIESGMESRGEKPKIKIEEGSALLFNPVGLLAETTPEEDPFEAALEEAFGGGSLGQISVHRLIDLLEAAKDDPKIDTMVMDLSGLLIPDIYLSKAEILADAVEDFRESGKRVISVGDGYGQNQFLVATEADEVLLHRQGFVFLTGYGRFRTYYSELLNKLDVTKNVFRVGTYKSALEPVLRDDMSPEAREANEAYLQVLWDAFTSRIDENRGLSAGSTDRFANAMVEAMREHGGDLALALEAEGLVDRLTSRADQRAYLAEIVGEDEEGELRLVAMERYGKTMKLPQDRDDVGNITVVTVEGAIVDGEQETGVASGEYISGLLREAREDEDVRAVVLRVDSPGGSVFASELIRNEVQALRAAGKPVVASMSSLAASGGYWISSPADIIFAQPTTLTGSIGIFAYLPTLENLAERIGVNTDGVGTTPYAGFAAVPIGPIPDAAKDLFQLSIEDGYSDFLQVVSEGRGIPVDRVAEIAEGRVWIGEDARPIELVDRFGGLDDAIAEAARIAGLEDWDISVPADERTPFERFIDNLATEASAKGWLHTDEALFGIKRGRFDRTTLGAAVKMVEEETRFQASFTDPSGLYARCLECTPY